MDLGKSLNYPPTQPTATTAMTQTTVSPNDCWQTPEWILETVVKISGTIDLDPCTTEENPTKATTYCTERGLEQDWDRPVVYINPPYSEKAKWLEKVVKEAHEHPGNCYYLLVPSSVMNNQSSRANAATASRIAMLGRVAFIAPDHLKKERTASGREANPGQPRTDISLLYWGPLTDSFTIYLQSAGYSVYQPTNPPKI